MKLRFSLDEVAQNAQAVARRFPVPLFYSALFATLAICYERNETLLLRDSCFAASLAVPLAIGLTFMRERYFSKDRRLRFLPQLTHLFALIFFWSFRNREDGKIIFQFCQLFLANHLFVSFAAFYRKKEDENRFWHFNQSLFFRWIVALVFSATLYLGVVAALFAVKNLFGVEPWGSRFYFDFWIFCATFFHSIIFLSGAPQPNESRTVEFPKILRIFCQYLLIPLLFVYFGILYVYLGKIIVQFQLPKGLVSSLVSGAAMFGMLAFLLVHPIRDQAAYRWIRIFSKGFAFALFPLVILMMVAIQTRTNEYGFTEGRYFMTVLSLWIAVMAVVLLRARDHAIRIIPISLFAVTLMTAIGPWSAWSVSLRSQTNRMLEILDRNGLRTNGMLAKTTKIIPVDDQKTLSSIFDYLITRHGYQSVAYLVPDDFKDKNVVFAKRSAAELMSYIGQLYYGPGQQKEYFYFNTAAGDAIQSLSVQDYAYVVPRFTSSRILTAAEKDRKARRFAFNPKTSNLEIYLPLDEKNSGVPVETVSLLPLVERIYVKQKTKIANSLPASDLVFDAPLKTLKLRIVFSNISGKWSTNPSERSIDGFEATLFYRAP